METVAILLIPSGNQEANLEPNGVSYFRILNVLEAYQEILIHELRKDGINRFGDDSEKITDWINQELKKDQKNNSTNNHILN
ncbi:hypothetical protein [Flavilitoribacter nigricans]|uniref:Uncharacterized protein n=1 Tax=Flavilitoribacter nigricans (strain ATCC 23147 / DSM 23189 / NBRC 102662 / NCIMB 1420 / SS-2) TaxID=1122177 RepID=A0A2D0NDM0_FLAN2|nr:hypothetical protein [Flavilitoribacter nigricans]PHN05863.1 hypothetical protein CRP01_15465 [Flavilitoribacter nigricans DSM 23189 = NBRC 102662]